MITSASMAAGLTSSTQLAAGLVGLGDLVDLPDDLPDVHDLVEDLVEDLDGDLDIEHEPAECDELVCEACLAYEAGRIAGKNAAFAEIASGVWVGHARGCGCRPCAAAFSVLLAATGSLRAQADQTDQTAAA